MALLPTAEAGLVKATLSLKERGNDFHQAQANSTAPLRIRNLAPDQAAPNPRADRRNSAMQKLGAFPI